MSCTLLLFFAIVYVFDGFVDVSSHLFFAVHFHVVFCVQFVPPCPRLPICRCGPHPFSKLDMYPQLVHTLLAEFCVAQRWCRAAGCRIALRALTYTPMTAVAAHILALMLQLLRELVALF